MSDILFYPLMVLLCVGIVVIIIGIFFRGGKVKGKIAGNEFEADLTNVDKKNNTIINNQNIQYIPIIDNIVTEVYNTAYNNSIIKNYDIPQQQLNMLNEKYKLFRNKIFEIFINLNISSDENQIIESLLSLYSNIFIESLKTTFKKNNWKEMSIVTFDDMVNERTKILVSEYKRIINNYCPNNINLFRYKKTLVTVFEDKRWNINEFFIDFIKNIYSEARLIKSQCEKKIDEENGKMSEKVENLKSIFSNNNDTNIKKKSKKKT